MKVCRWVCASLPPDDLHPPKWTETSDHVGRLTAGERSCFIRAIVWLCFRTAMQALVYPEQRRPSVCPSHSDKQTRFIDGEPEDSIIGTYQDHPEIRKRCPRAWTLSESGVGTNWRFSTYKPAPKRCKIEPGFLLITNRKSHMHFRLVPKSTRRPSQKLDWR